MEYQIEKNVPIPDFVPRGARTAILSRMEVGDSFLVPNEDSRKVTPQFSAQAKRLGIQIICRNVEGGSRVWRVA